MLHEMLEDMTEEMVYEVAEDVPLVEDFGARSISFSETASKNGAVAEAMFDTSIGCTVQSASSMATNGTEDLNNVDGRDLDGSPELIELKGKVSTLKLNPLSESLDVSKDEALNLIASDSQSECRMGTTSEGLVRRYTRSVLEALRFVDVDKQQQKWNEMYKDLETVVLQEYDEISTGSEKKVKQNYNQRRQQEKKKEASFSKSVLVVEDIGKVANALEMSGLVCSSNVEESWATEEDQCVEDDSDDEYDSIQRPAFLVEGEPDFESGPPQDGLEYLRRVRWEAAQMPKVKVAKLDRTKWSSEQTPYMPKIAEIAKCPENLSPLQNWVDIFLADFSELRKALSEFGNSTDRAIYTSSDKDLGEGAVGLQKKSIPTVSAVLDMDCVSRAAMLRNKIKAFESASVLTRDNCLWMFALCAAVDTPFDAEMSSCLRCLLRKCSSLLTKKSELDEEVAMLNILIAISGKYFGQLEN